MTRLNWADELLSKMMKCSIIHDKSKRTQQGNMSG